MTGPTRDKASPKGEVLSVFDATAIIGLRVHVHDAAIQRRDVDGEVDIELPGLGELLAVAAICRCLMPLKLRGSEMRSIRKIMGLTAGELASKLGERTAAETVSRWENEKQPMGGYVERSLRLLVCEELKSQAPGVAYDAGMIVKLRVLDPWLTDKDFEVPYLEVHRVRAIKGPGDVVDVYMKNAA